LSLTQDRLLALLSRYVSTSTASGIIRYVANATKIDPANLDANSLKQWIDLLDMSVSPFLSEVRRADLKREIMTAVATRSTRSRMFAIRSEEDVGKARLGARHICQEAGAVNLTSLQVATCVSELARNIIQYARPGLIELVMQDKPRRSVLVRAVDKGPGIPHLDDVLTGVYHSKTGQGRGLAGVRKVASRFNVKTGSDGTSVEFEVWF
jgi:serine/threonine-protein kinase RsbT